MKIMIYHVKSNNNWNDKNYFSRKSLKSILFLSRLFIETKTRYWSTKLKFVDIVWMFKKIRHLIKFFVIITIIYIDHDVVLNLIKQIIFIISFTNKFNLRLIRVFDYIQKFNFEIRHKSNKMHIVSNVLFRFVNFNTNSKKHENEKKLNVLFIIILINMKNVFRKRFLKNYFNDSIWKKKIVLLNQQKIVDVENNVSFFLSKKKFDFSFRWLHYWRTRVRISSFLYFSIFDNWNIWYDSRKQQRSFKFW